MSASSFYQRYAELRLIESLADSPVVLICGPCQCGMSTLAQRVGERMGYSYGLRGHLDNSTRSSEVLSSLDKGGLFSGRR